MRGTDSLIWRPSDVLNKCPHVEELFARDHVVLHRIEPDFVVRDPLPAGFGGELDREIHGKAAGAGAGIAAKERPAKVPALDVVFALPNFGFADDRLLADGFLAVA